MAEKREKIYKQDVSWLAQELWQRTVLPGMPENLLIEAAREVVKTRFKENRHTVGAALRTKSGQVFTAVHLEASVGRMAICAEAIALGMAATAGDTEVDTIVAANRYGDIVSPCGMCRELITDYAPEARVIIEVQMPGGHAAFIWIPMEKLLPVKYINSNSRRGLGWWGRAQTK